MWTMQINLYIYVIGFNQAINTKDIDGTYHPTISKFVWSTGMGFCNGGFLIDYICYVVKSLALIAIGQFWSLSITPTAT